MPEVASFAAGQAAFTMMVLIVFNLIQPTGWQVGLIRVEDIDRRRRGRRSGVAAAVAARARQRGVGGRSTPPATSARSICAPPCRRVTRGASDGRDRGTRRSGHDARGLANVDDAVRQYLSESGGPTDHRAPVVRSANRAIRLRAAAELIADIRPRRRRPIRTRDVLEAHADAVCDRLSGAHRQPTATPISDDFVLALRAEAAGASPVADALPLVTVAANLGELELLYPS